MPVIPTLMGWGTIPDDHPLMAGMFGLQTSAPLRQRDDARVATSCSASATAGPTATPARSTSTPRAASSCTSTSSRRRSAACSHPDLGIVSDAKAALELFVAVASEWKAAGKLKDRGGVGRRVPRAQAHDAAQDQFRQRADQAAARLSGDEQARSATRHLLRHDDRPVADRRRAVPARLQAAQLDQLRPGRPARLDDSRRRSACAPPIRRARSSRCRATTISSS